MIKSVLAKVASRANPLLYRDPFTNVYGLARTLLAIETACTIASNRPNVLFTPIAGFDPLSKCSTGIISTSLFCVIPASKLEIARWLSIGILAVVASGWRPRLTAIPHLWVAFSFFSSVTIFDGGDQITLVLTVLMLPVALLDPRRWHWFRSDHSENLPLARLIAWSALMMIRIQVSGVYFVSGIAKLGQPDWQNGTAMYYWLVTFAGAPRWAIFLVEQPLIVVALTWGAIALEITLAAALVLPKKFWQPLLIAGIAFHLLIIAFFNLSSFAIAMMAALILYLRPADSPFSSKILITEESRKVQNVDTNEYALSSNEAV